MKGCDLFQFVDAVVCMRFAQFPSAFPMPQANYDVPRITPKKKAKMHRIKIYFFIIPLFIGIMLESQIYATTGNLDVYVKNLDGSYVSGASVVRYTSGWSWIDNKSTNTSGKATWTGITTGEYNVEAYFNGDFWGNKSVKVNSGQTATETIQRQMPYASNIYTMDANGKAKSDFTLGETVYIKVEVKNGTTTPHDVRVKVEADRDKNWTADFNQTSGYQTVDGSGTMTYTFIFKPSDDGTYYLRPVETHTRLNTNVKTDSWAWGSPSFTVTSKDAYYVKGTSNCGCVRGTSLENSSVSVYRDGKRIKNTIAIGGNYLITGLTPGTYNIRASKRGYITSAEYSFTLYGTQFEAILNIPELKPASAQKKSISGWIPDWGFQKAMNSFVSNYDVFDVISPTWYQISGSGNGDLIPTRTPGDSDLILFARSKNIAIVPSICMLPPA
ncbi:MAG: BatD family protein, partial [bacterium]